MSNRITYIDTIKGIAIILVVMGHALGFILPEGQITAITTGVSEYGHEGQMATIVWKIIYSFHMPLFMFCSGIFAISGIWEKLRNGLGKYIKRLIIPYITTGFLCLWSRDHFGYWYLLSLFEFIFLANMVMLLASNISKQYKTFLYILINVLVWTSFQLLYLKVGNTCLELSRYFVLYPFFILGTLIRSQIKWCDRILKNEIVICFSAVCFILLEVSIYYYPIAKDIFANTLINSLIDKIRIFGIPFFAILLIMYLAKYKMPQLTKINKGLSYVGERTLQIYILHNLCVPPYGGVLEYFMKAGTAINSITLQIFYSSFITIYALVFSLSVGWVIKQNKYLNLLLFGK